MERHPFSGSVERVICFLCVSAYGFTLRAHPLTPPPKGKGSGSGVWPSMVTHTWNLCSAFNPSKCTHTVVNIHLEQWAANAAAPGEQLGVWCLAQGSHLSRGIEGGESAGYSLPPPTIPARPEIRTHDLRVTSPTLYSLGHNCPLW